MILVNKEEKEIISKVLPKIHFIRTEKGRSKRHHYYCEENVKVRELIDKIRSGEY